MLGRLRQGHQRGWGLLVLLSVEPEPRLTPWLTESRSQHMKHVVWTLTKVYLAGSCSGICSNIFDMPCIIEVYIQALFLEQSSHLLQK